MDYILIKDLDVFCRIGLEEPERENRQRISFDLKLGMSKWLSTNLEGDIQKTICYQTVSKKICKSI
jgi:FolB domain-containing protein